VDPLFKEKPLRSSCFPAVHTTTYASAPDKDIGVFREDPLPLPFSKPAQQSRQQTITLTKPLQIVRACAPVDSISEHPERMKATKCTSPRVKVLHLDAHCVALEFYLKHYLLTFGHTQP
jgi:hypothetical protein